jgi:hypothetical protein
MILKNKRKITLFMYSTKSVWILDTHTTISLSYVKISFIEVALIWIIILLKIYDCEIILGSILSILVPNLKNCVIFSIKGFKFLIHRRLALHIKLSVG